MTGPEDPAQRWRQALEYGAFLADELDDQRRKRAVWARIRMQHTVHPGMPNPFLLYARQRATAVHARLRRATRRWSSNPVLRRDIRERRGEWKIIREDSKLLDPETGRSWSAMQRPDGSGHARRWASPCIPGGAGGCRHWCPAR